jgi:uncharacterized protein (DUF486 family)
LPFAFWWGKAVSVGLNYCFCGELLMKFASIGFIMMSMKACYEVKLLFAWGVGEDEYWFEVCKLQMGAIPRGKEYFYYCAT